MENTKENRQQYLRDWFSTITANRRLDKAKLIASAEELNSVLSRKRKVRVVELWSELRSELRSELESGLWSGLWSELESGLRSGLWSGLRSELWSELWSYSFWEFWESVWPIFVREYYPELKTLKKNKKKIDALEGLLRSGCGYILLSKKTLLVIPFPQVKLSDRKLHDESSWALNFLGKKTHWLSGVKFPKSLWKEVVEKKISAKKLLSIENIEQRMAALRVMGMDWLLADANAVLLDTHEKKIGGFQEYRLYRLDDVFSQPAYLLAYECPSTGRKYVSGIDPTFAKEHPKAELCAGWKWGLETIDLVELES